MLMSQITKDNKAIMETHVKAMPIKQNLVKHTKDHSKPKFIVDSVKGDKKNHKKVIKKAKKWSKKAKKVKKTKKDKKSLKKKKILKKTN